MNVNKHENWQLNLEPADFELSELYHRDVQSLNRLAQLNFNIKAIILRKRAKSLKKFFLQLWKSVSDDFLQITGNKCI